MWCLMIFIFGKSIGRKVVISFFIGRNCSVVWFLVFVVFLLVLCVVSLMKWLMLLGILIFVKCWVLFLGWCIVIVRFKFNLLINGNGWVGLMVSGVRMGKICLLK